MLENESAEIVKLMEGLLDEKELNTGARRVDRLDSKEHPNSEQDSHPCSGKCNVDRLAGSAEGHFPWHLEVIARDVCQGNLIDAQELGQQLSVQPVGLAAALKHGTQPQGMCDQNRAHW